MTPTILSQPWLFGALLSVAASGLGISGVTLLKTAQRHIVDGASSASGSPSCVGTKRPVRWRRLLREGTWWRGLLLVVGCHPVVLYALTFTPESTVIPLGAFKVCLNIVLAYGILNERFTVTDLWATAGCISGTVVAFVSMPHSMPGYMEDFPTQTLWDFCGQLDSNPGFAVYCFLWAFLLAVGLYASLSVSLTGDLKPCMLPLLMGLFNSQFHFLTKVLTTMAFHPDKQPQPWQQCTGLVALATAVLAVAAIGTTCEGVRQLDCRFFVPAAFATTTVMIALEDVLFFREWQHMTNFNLVCFVCGSTVTVVGAIMVSPSHSRIASQKNGSSAPLLAVNEEPLQQYQGVLRVMEEHKIIAPRKSGAKPLEVISLDSPEKGFWAVLRSLWQWMPITACLGALLMCLGLCAWNCEFMAFFILTVWGVHNGWKYGLHMALFSYVGQRKMAQYENCDFLALHRLQQQQEASKGGPPPEGPKWEDVVHYVILPNYKEDLDVLRLAVGSIAASPMSAAQICLVLAMEAREKEAESKAKILLEEFGSQFRVCLTTVHPADIPGQIAGKASNVNWAASQLLGSELKKAGLDLDNVVITIADADSEFHPRYFEALTYQFIHAGCSNHEVPDRYLSIWQPPIIHYKNYHSQPIIVRLASLFTSQHELANLADPNAMRVPYSTYSISATLAKAVRGWDPDWISEDWHMGFKCFLATAGRFRIQPIFLGIMNYAPEAGNYQETVRARWEQAKRHALGFSEIVFFQDHFPRVLLSIEGGWKKRAVFVWRAFFLWSRCLLIHLTMALMLLIGSLTALIIAYFLRNQILEDLNSWTFLTYLVFQSTSGISVVLFMFTNVLLYELTQSRIDTIGTLSNASFFQNRWLHFLWVTATSMALMPFFFFAGGMAEWIAAVKTARTHKFVHDVAMKPSVSQQALASGVGQTTVAVAKTNVGPKAATSIGA